MLKLHFDDDGHVAEISVDMGQAEVFPEKHIMLNGSDVMYTTVSVGNPHAVIFTDNIGTEQVEEVGRAMQNHSDFPDGVNVELVSKMSSGELRMRVWERGSGITMACGTGACASAVAAVHRGLCRYDSPIAVVLDGGTLEVCVSKNNRVIMTGPAQTVFEGEIKE